MRWQQSDNQSSQYRDTSFNLISFLPFISTFLSSLNSKTEMQGAGAILKCVDFRYLHAQKKNIEEVNDATGKA